MGNQFSKFADYDEETKRLLPVLKSEMLKLGQGDYEMEMTFGENIEWQLQQHKNRCLKNPGHKYFVPIKQLEMNHLPLEYRDLYNDVKSWADFIVRIQVGITSPNRTPLLGCANLKGRSDVVRFGSGYLNSRITDVHYKNQRCPFKNCSISKAPHMVSAYFDITTTASLVLDDVEAEKTSIDFFYDDENDKSTIVQAQGVKVEDVFLLWEWCKLTCVSHDLSLLPKLRHLQDLDAIESRKPFLIYRAKMMSSFAFVISHPHGLSKQVSFGEIVHCHELTPQDPVAKMRDNKKRRAAGRALIEESMSCIMDHTVPTCCGCTGGSLKSFQHRLDSPSGYTNVCIAPQSRHKVGQINTSGIGDLQKLVRKS